MVPHFKTIVTQRFLGSQILILIIQNDGFIMAVEFFFLILDETFGDFQIALNTNFMYIFQKNSNLIFFLFFSNLMFMWFCIRRKFIFFVTLIIWNFVLVYLRWWIPSGIESPLFVRKKLKAFKFGIYYDFLGFPSILHWFIFFSFALK